MKLLPLLAILVTAGLILSPFWLLPKTESPAEAYDVIRGWEDNGNPIRVDHPIVRYDLYGANVKSIDSSTCGDTTSSMIQGDIYDGPYSYHYLLRDEGRPVVRPCLAAELPTISDDRLTYTIPLKKGVLFQRNPCFGQDDLGRDATREVVAEDFVYAFKRIADHHNTCSGQLAWPLITGRIVGLDEYRAKTKEEFSSGQFQRYDLPVEGIVAVDAHTLRIKLTKPYPQLTQVLAMHLYAPTPHEAVSYWLAGEGRLRTPIPLAERTVEFMDPRMIVGTGAYLLKTFDRKHKIVLVRNPDFREEYYPTEEEMLAAAPEKAVAREWIEQLRAMNLLQDAGRRVPFIDILEYTYVAESFSQWNLFLSKQTDASGIPKETFDAVVTPGKQLTDEWKQKGIYLRKYWPPVIYWFVFNMKDPLLQASPALRRAMCLGYDVQSQIDVLANGRGRPATSIVPSTFKAHVPGPYYRYDLEQAKRQLDLAKEELAAAGLLTEDGEIPEIAILMSEGANRQGDFARQQFGKIGLSVRPDYMDWGTLQDKVHTGQAQMYTMGWHADYYDAENFLQLFYSENIQSGTNNAHYSNPAFDAIYEKARVLPDSPERTALYKQAIEIVCEDCPVLMLSEPMSVALFYEWYRNVLAHPIGYGFSMYRRIDPDLRARMGGRN
jgi:ABC-type transport system substrate-binding protein